MRDHAIVSPQFWTGETGRALRRDPDAQRVAFYLMTCPNANMIGLYYLPLPLLCHEVGIDEEGAIKGLARLSQVQFCAYDLPSETVFVFNMARYQIGESLERKDNRYKGVVRMLGQTKNSPFYNDFLAMYGESYGLDLPPIPRPFQAPSKPLPSPLVGGLFIDQDQEQEKEQEQEQEECGGSKAPRAQDGEDGRDIEVVLGDDHVMAYTFATDHASHHAAETFEPSAAVVAQAAKDAPHVNLERALKRFKTCTFKQAVIDWNDRFYRFVLEDEDRHDARQKPRNPQGMTDREYRSVQNGVELAKEIMNGTYRQHALPRITERPRGDV